MKIDRTTRILIFLPHPDDEALATAGLLQRAAAREAMVRVVFVTRGEDNPWPQRVLARRWKIEPVDRMQWAARRTDEALASLATLGVSSDSISFLDLPDQRITSLYLGARAKVIAQLARIIARVQPNLVVTPAPFDLHPDHSALHLFVRAALTRSGDIGIQQLTYLVHTRGYHSDWNRFALELTPSEQETKRRAILCHRTQIMLSRKRFLRHARPCEEFWQPVAAREIDFHHPIRGGQFSREAVVLQLQRRRHSFSRCSLLLAAESETRDDGDAWFIRLRRASGMVQMVDSTGKSVGLADFEVRNTQAQITIPLPTAPAYLFAKLKEPSVFFDSAGWREIPVTIRHWREAQDGKLKAGSGL